MPGLVVYMCNPVLEKVRQEDHPELDSESWASLGYRMRSIFKQQKRKEKDLVSDPIGLINMKI